MDDSATQVRFFDFLLTAPDPILMTKAPIERRYSLSLPPSPPTSGRSTSAATLSSPSDRVGLGSPPPSALGLGCGRNEQARGKGNVGPSAQREPGEGAH